MDFTSLNDDDSVGDSISQIEDKLYERGMLVSAVGDSEAEVSIAFENYEIDGDECPYVMIRISSEDIQREDEEQFERIGDFVDEKISDAVSSWTAECQEAYGASCGQMVLLNGRKVY